MQRLFQECERQRVCTTGPGLPFSRHGTDTRNTSDC
jgi:hypothetical protein